MTQLTLLWYLQVGGVMLAASTLQGAIGFAGAVFAIPCLVLLGAPLPQAAALALTSSLLQNFSGAFHLRSETTLREIAMPASLRLIALPAGVWIMGRITALSSAEVEGIVGGAVLSVVALQLFARTQSPRPPRPALAWSAFLFSGLMQGACGMGGPPLALWTMSRPWSAAKARSFLFFLALFGWIPNLALLVWEFGADARDGFTLAVLVLPFTIVGIACGLRIGGRLSRGRLQAATYTILLATGAAAVASALIG